MSYYYYGIEKLNVEVNIPDENIYIDSENTYDNFNILLTKLKHGDVIYLEQISVLGSIDEIIDRWKKLVDEIKVDVVLCDYPIVDTRKLEYTPSDYLAYILNYVNSKQDEYKQKRQELQAQGIQRARQAGVQFGRPTKMKQETFEEQYQNLHVHGIDDVTIREILGLSKTTFWRYRDKMRKKMKEEK